MKHKRKIEVFTAGCPLCDKAVKLVKSLACENCEVIVYDLRKQGIQKARKYGVAFVPTVVIDGKIADCCKRGEISEQTLINAGVGQPI
ncbi:MAG: thioredoxin family protein [candidate division Zixibacteria bacterium]|nr:thioredoxin family protein [candidate division Zixibacteria bacterium]